MKLNRKWLMVIALVMSLTMATAGTLAYLTDRDTEVNVFTMGNVDIELKEDFEQGVELIPGVNVEKEPTITNVGKNDAWVWATIAIPSALDEVNDASKNVLHFNYSPDVVGEGKWTWQKDGAWMVEKNVDHDGVAYNVYTVLYQTALKKGDTTEPVIYKVYMDAHVDVAPDGELYHVEKGEATKLNWNINNDGNPKMYVSAYAMQTDGFATVQEAYAAYTKQWTSSNEAKDAIAWGEDDGLTDGTFISTEGWEGGQAYDDENSAAIFELLEDGKDVIIGKSDLVGFAENALDAKGANVMLNGEGPGAYGYLAFLPAAGEDVELSNLNVTGSGFVEVGHWGQGGGDYTLNNVEIKNLGATLNNGDKGFNLGCAFMAYGDAILNDCVITGTTAVQDGVMPVDLGCGQPWSGYTDDDDNKITTTVNGGKFGTVYCWSHSIVNVDGAEIDTIYVSPINGQINIKAGTYIKTMKVDYGTSAANAARLAKINIEDGATIDKIVFEGTTYTVTEWKDLVANFGN